jgi:hypothetical protein
MEKTLEELKQEANGLGITYSPNIGAGTLADKIEAYYESQSAGDVVQMVEEDEVAGEAPPVAKTLTKQAKINLRVAEAKKKAFSKKVVTLTSNDKRTNEYETTAYLSFENQYFGLSKLVPLDIPVELEVGLIEVAKSTKILIHKDEIVEGKRTGNKTSSMIRKYNVSYEES